MQTKILMMASALTMLLFGILLTFAPQEMLGFGGGTTPWSSVAIAQAAGSLYLGFAALNWMAQDNLIGGIYSRPVAVGNFFHFSAMVLTLTRTIAGGHHIPVLFAVTFLYLVLAASFGLVLFGSPRSIGQQAPLGREHV